MHGISERCGNSYPSLEFQLVATSTTCGYAGYLGAQIRAFGRSAFEKWSSLPDGGGGPLERLRRNIWTVMLGQDAGGHAADFYELVRPLPSDS